MRVLWGLGLRPTPPRVSVALTRQDMGAREQSAPLIPRYHPRRGANPEKKALDGRRKVLTNTKTKRQAGWASASRSRYVGTSRH